MHADLKTRLAALPDVAARLRWLREHRLLGLISILDDRGLLPADLAVVAKQVADQTPAVSQAQLDEETRVVSALRDSGCEFLVLKGVLLAYSVYASPQLRWRCDLDVLVHPDQLAVANRVMRDLGYAQLWAGPGGTPIQQQAWSIATPEGCWAVDVHENLRNHPLLRERLSFQEQWQQRRELKGLGERVYGQSTAHALLNASMHWFDNLYATPRPLAWLLDIDLLWRAMSSAEQASTLALAADRGLADLLIANLRQAAPLFQTPFDEDELKTFQNLAAGQAARKLMAFEGRPIRLYWHAIGCEPGLAGKVRRLGLGLFPPAAYMRARYPEHARSSLPRLYIKRVLDRIRSVIGR